MQPGPPPGSPGDAPSVEPTTLTTSRQNIPAVCRIPQRGTGFLVSPGLIMTSTRVVGTKSEAAKLTAVFFEGGKRPRVEVKLLPSQFYFAAAFPEHLDYCLVACETTKIFNVTPVKLPLVQPEWSSVREGDTLLVVEHPVHMAGGVAGAQHTRATTAAAAAAANNPATQTSPVGNRADATPPPGNQTTDGSINSGNTTTGLAPASTVKRFVEVLRRKDDRIFGKPTGSYLSAGCPCFNDHGDLVALLAQVPDPETEAMTCVGVSIVSAVKHLFANGRISRIQQEPLFSDVWSTWAVPGDTARIIAILTNFSQKALHHEASLRFFDHCHEREHTSAIIAGGGTQVLLNCLRRHGPEDAEYTHGGLRALWALSFDVEDNRSQIRDANGIETILAALESFPRHEGIVQYSAVLLYNVTLTPSTVTTEWAPRALSLLFSGATRFEQSEVIQKFLLGFLQNTVLADTAYGREILDSGIMNHVTRVMTAYPDNEYLNEHGVRMIAKVAQCPAYASSSALAPCVPAVITAVLRFESSNKLRVEANHALWGLGMDPRRRIAILNHPRGIEALQTSIGIVNATLPSQT